MKKYTRLPIIRLRPVIVVKFLGGLGGHLSIVHQRGGSGIPLFGQTLLELTEKQSQA
jgi:hypothetical protein